VDGPFIVVSLTGSGDWIRTSDLVVTLIYYFRSGVDYLIIPIARIWDAGRYRRIIVRLTF